MRIRHLILALVLLTACGGGGVVATTTEPEAATTIAPSTTTSTSTTTTTTTMPTTTTVDPEVVAAAEYESDVQLIKQLWRRYSDSWFGGREAGYQYLEENNYPAEGCTADDFAAAFSETGEGYAEEVVVDESTIERDDGWPIPGGQASGTVPDGRIYIMTVTITYSEPGLVSSSETLEVHATVDGDEAYMFFACAN